MPSDSYRVEELLTFGRINRAVCKRVVKKAELMAGQGVYLDRQRLEELTDQEWQAVKDAIRSSPMAKEAAREQIRRMVSGMLDSVARSDKAQD